jgi:hypothetical protein
MARNRREKKREKEKLKERKKKIRMKRGGSRMNAWTPESRRREEKEGKEEKLM